MTLQDREDKLLPELQNQCHSVHNLYQHCLQFGELKCAIIIRWVSSCEMVKLN